MTEVILQKGKEGGDLFIYCHIGADIIRQRVAEDFPDDAVVTYVLGEGTAAYRGLLGKMGGWAGWTDSLVRKIGHSVRRCVLTTWSAGSTVVQELAVDPSGWYPTAIVMLDGLYGSKPPGAKMGDGQVLPSPWQDGIAHLAELAAAEDGLTHFIATFSNIPTPYASSKECNELVLEKLKDRLGTGVGPDTFTDEINGHHFIRSYRQGKFFMYEFPGQDAKEHIRNAHMYPVFWSWVKNS